MIKMIILIDRIVGTYCICIYYQITDKGNSTENVEKKESIENDVCRSSPGLFRRALQIYGEYSGINS